MEVEEAIEKRRSFRSLKKVDISPEIIEKLGKASQLMCSCYNNQPWRYIFVYDDPQLTQLKEEAIKPGNQWAKAGSLIIAVLTKPDLDCVIEQRNYAFFDTGMAVGSLLLEATNLGLVAHPIAGFNAAKVHEILKIPEDFTIITLIIVGQKDITIPDYFKDYQVKSEQNRPPRKSINEFLFHNSFQDKDG